MKQERRLSYTIYVYYGSRETGPFAGVYSRNCKQNLKSHEPKLNAYSRRMETFGSIPDLWFSSVFPT